eukprot:Opistho-2@67564
MDVDFERRVTGSPASPWRSPRGKGGKGGVDLCDRLIPSRKNSDFHLLQSNASGDLETDVNPKEDSSSLYLRLLSTEFRQTSSGLGGFSVSGNVGSAALTSYTSALTPSPGDAAIYGDENAIYEGTRGVGHARAGAATPDAPIVRIARTQGSARPGILQYRSLPAGTPIDPEDALSLSPVGREGRALLASQTRHPRKIPKVPFKVLDAPELQDDFYLNLVDWSSQNVLGVALGASVYLWSACTSHVTKLCDLAPEGDAVNAIAWHKRGTHIAVGTMKGLVQIWDVAQEKRVRVMDGHLSRVGTLAWSNALLASGSRDRSILLRDLRAPGNFTSKLEGHRQEVCGLRWSPDEEQLASGGNDNKLFVWGRTHTTPIQRFAEHTAAVKAIAWSPHQHGLLASGGGTADRCIRFWNTVTGQALQHTDTGSQVCNLVWSKTVNEIVSTHGYSQNQIVVWKYPSMRQIATLTGHTYRVLYLAMSPDGQTIVTGAGDETLRFWNVFSKSRSPQNKPSPLNLFSQIR